MSRKEVIRPGLLRALAKGQVTTRQVARALRVTVRHVYRLQQRFAEGGAGGVVHRGRGRPSARRLAPAVRERVAALMGTAAPAAPSAPPAPRRAGRQPAAPRRQSRGLARGARAADDAPRRPG